MEFAVWGGDDVTLSGETLSGDTLCDTLSGDDLDDLDDDLDDLDDDLDGLDLDNHLDVNVGPLEPLGGVEPVAPLGGMGDAEPGPVYADALPRHWSPLSSPSFSRTTSAGTLSSSASFSSTTSASTSSSSFSQTTSASTSKASPRGVVEPLVGAEEPVEPLGGVEEPGALAQPAEPQGGVESLVGAEEPVVEPVEPLGGVEEPGELADSAEPDLSGIGVFDINEFFGNGGDDLESFATACLNDKKEVGGSGRVLLGEKLGGTGERWGCRTERRSPEEILSGFNARMKLREKMAQERAKEREKEEKKRKREAEKAERTNAFIEAGKRTRRPPVKFDIEK
jgi:hypothetical protein